MAVMGAMRQRFVLVTKITEQAPDTGIPLTIDLGHVFLFSAGVHSFEIDNRAVLNRRYRNKLLRRLNMSGCGCGCSNGIGVSGGPFSKGKELVEFVYNAHGGAVRDQPIAKGPLAIECQGCKTPFSLETYLGRCPECGGIHAVAPMQPVAENVQFAGTDFTLP